MSIFHNVYIEKILYSSMEHATFAAGCFWGVEYVFSQTPGVLSVESGYTGGAARFTNPTYEDVCSGVTGHAEAVRVTFDPKKITYKELLDIFWECHDPTQKDRQGPDIGSQYRSAIFYHTPQQKREAEISKKKWGKEFDNPIVTEITKVGAFYRAEEYHQQYFKKHPGMAACHVPMKK